MELPNIGKHCEESTCNQLDFLPYQCKCKKIFCVDHYMKHIQECPIIKEHYKQANLDAKSGMWLCSHPECKEKSLVPLICEKCHQHFCVAHRHVTECFKEDPAIRAAAIAKIRAPVEQFNEAKAKVDKQLDENIKAATKNSKKNEMAVKLQLMRIKNKATGQKSIPSADRVYFNVTKPKSCGGATQAVFLARNWSVGRAIDAIADECKVPNKNNEPTADKLRLFTADGAEGVDFVEDLGRILNDLLKDKQLIDGQNLRLEYVSS